ncbi:MAG: DUF3822 family protein [Bacteroidetes bacterium]|jgi:hypothetical protein|nr:DUF3822 family protein [Bacteroidota bacterium]
MTESEKDQTLYNLSILIRQDGFSFSIYPSNSTKITSFGAEEFGDIQSHKVLLEMVENAIIKHQISAYAFHQTTIYYQTPKYVICPDELFVSDQIPVIFNLSHSLNELEEIRCEYNSGLKAYMIFSMPTELVSLLLRHFEGCAIYPTAWSHLEYLSDHDKFALIHITPHLFDMMVAQNGKLIHLNSYYYEVNNDFLYFTLNTLKQLGMDSKTLPVYIQGDISRFNQKFQQLRQFAPKLTIVDTKPIQGPLELTNQLKLKYWTLFKPLCA